VSMAVPENPLGFVESIGLRAVAYGPNSQAQLEEDLFHNWSKFGNPVHLWQARGTSPEVGQR
jgi:hypothetical protein